MSDPPLGSKDLPSIGEVFLRSESTPVRGAKGDYILTAAQVPAFICVDLRPLWIRSLCLQIQRSVLADHRSLTDFFSLWLPAVCSCRLTT